MNTGIPQFCSITFPSNSHFPPTYSLYSFDQQLLQTHSFHSVPSESKSQEKETGIVNKRQLFIQGLVSKKQALEKEIALLRDEYQIISSLQTKSITPLLKPLVLYKNVEEEEEKEKDSISSCKTTEKEIDIQMVKIKANHSIVLQITLPQSSPSLLLFHQTQSLHLPSSSSSSSSSLHHTIYTFWLPPQLVEDVVYCCRYNGNTVMECRRIDLASIQTIEINDSANFPRFLFQGESPFFREYKYFSARIKYQREYDLIFDKSHLDIMNSDSLLIDCISMNSTGWLIKQAINQLLNEIAFLKKEVNVSLFLIYHR